MLIRVRVRDIELVFDPTYVTDISIEVKPDTWKTQLRTGATTVYATASMYLNLSSSRRLLIFNLPKEMRKPEEEKQLLETLWYVQDQLRYICTGTVNHRKYSSAGVTVTNIPHLPEEGQKRK